MFNTVRIPVFVNDSIVDVKSVRIFGQCPVCHGPRGQSNSRVFWEGGKLYECDEWKNPCGHVDLYEQADKENKTIKNFQQFIDTVGNNLLKNLESANGNVSLPVNEQECVDLILGYLDSRTIKP